MISFGIYFFSVYINCTKRFYCDVSIHAYYPPLLLSCPPPTLFFTMLMGFFHNVNGFLSLFSRMHIEYFDRTHPSSPSLLYSFPFLLVPHRQSPFYIQVIFFLALDSTDEKKHAIVVLLSESHNSTSAYAFLILRILSYALHPGFLHL
jgi:hypothetical protein